MKKRPSRGNEPSKGTKGNAPSKIESKRKTKGFKLDREIQVLDLAPRHLMVENDLSELYQQDMHSTSKISKQQTLNNVFRFPESPILQADEISQDDEQPICTTPNNTPASNSKLDIDPPIETQDDQLDADPPINPKGDILNLSHQALLSQNSIKDPTQEDNMSISGFFNAADWSSSSIPYPMGMEDDGREYDILGSGRVDIAVSQETGLEGDALGDTGELEDEMLGLLVWDGR